MANDRFRNLFKTAVDGELFSQKLLEEAGSRLSYLQTKFPTREFFLGRGGCSSIIPTSFLVRLIDGPVHTRWPIDNIIVYRMPSCEDIAQGSSVVKAVIACPNLSDHGQCNLSGDCRPINGVQPRSSIES